MIDRRVFRTASWHCAYSSLFPIRFEMNAALTGRFVARSRVPHSLALRHPRTWICPVRGCFCFGGSTTACDQRNLMLLRPSGLRRTQSVSRQEARSTFSNCVGEGTGRNAVPSPRLRGEGAPQSLICGADEVPLAAMCKTPPRSKLQPATCQLRASGPKTRHFETRVPIRKDGALL